MKVTTVPVLDTGIGISQGYASDAEFAKAAAAERAKQPPEIQALFDEADRRLERLILFGEEPQ